MNEKKSAYAESGPWTIDIDMNTTSGEWIVQLRSKSVYVEFWCPGRKTIESAVSYLEQSPKKESQRIGTFGSDLTVELTSFGEAEEMFLSVSKPEEAVMAFTLGSEDRQHLVKALREVCRQT